MPRERTHSAECWRWHADCAYERGRADERAKLAAEYRGIADDPDALRDWMTARGLYEYEVPDVPLIHGVAVTLRTVAGDIGSRLGGYEGADDG